MSYANGDTMIDAMALTSPSGHMSKRARKAAIKRLGKELFPDGIPAPTCIQPTEYERLKQRAQELRTLANRGMSPRKFRMEADRLEKEAEYFTRKGR